MEVRIKNARPYLEYCLVFLLFTVPLVQVYISDLFFIHTTEKSLIFRIIIGVCAVLYLCIKPLGRPMVTPLMASGLVLLSVVSISNTVGVDPNRSMWGTIERMQGFIATINYVAYFLMLSKMICPYKGRLVAYLALMSIVSTVMAIWGISTEVNQLFTNSCYAGSYFLLGVFITILLAKLSSKLRYVLIVPVFVQLYALYLTDNRGAIIAAGLSFIAWAIAYIIKKKPGVAMSMALVSMGVVMLVAVNNVVFVHHTPKQFTGELRLDTWALSLNGIAERPLLGWGQDNFDVMFDKHSVGTRVAGQRWDSSHSMVVDRIVESGIVGFILFVLFCYLMARTVYKTNRIDWQEKILLGAVATGFIINGLFIFSTIVLSMHVAVLVAYVWHIDHMDAEIEFRKDMSLTTPLLIGLSFYCLCVSVSDLSKYNSFANILNGDSKIRARIVEFKEYFASPPKCVDYTRLFYLEWAKGAINHKDIKEKYKGELYNIALYEINKSIKAHPRQVKLRLFWGKFVDSIRGSYRPLLN